MFRTDSPCLTLRSLRPVQHPRAGKIKLVGPAVSYNGKRMPVTRPPPWLSQHTTEVDTPTASAHKFSLELTQGTYGAGVFVERNQRVPIQGGYLSPSI